MTRSLFRTCVLAGVIAGLFGVLPSARAVHPPSGAWMTLGATVAARNGAAAAALANGRVLITGGRTSSGVTATAEVFDVTTGISSAIADMPTPRANHTATTLADGRVLVAGGVAQDGAPMATAAADLYDPFTNTWTTVWMQEARAHHTASRLDDGRVLVAGGDSLDVPTASVEVFDLTANTFTTLGPLTIARTQHAAAVRLDGTVVIAGGVNGGGVLSSTDIIDPADGTIVAGPAMSTPRARFTATTLITGDVLVVGGTDGPNDLASAERLSLGSGVFAMAGALAAPRSGHVAVPLAENGGVLVAGGGPAAAPLATAELFLPNSGFFVSTGSMSVGHVGAVASPLLTAGTVFVAGGYATAVAETYGYATLKTDKDDYPPGETVTITGTGWVPGETVTMLLEEAPLLHSVRALTAVADAQGSIVNTDFAPEEHHLGVRFYLTAYGSQSEAQWTFTDGNPQAVTLSPESVEVAQGSNATFTATVVVGGNTTPCTVTLSTSGVLPAGAAATFSGGPNPFTTTNLDVSRTLTVTTSAATSAGTYPFTVQATRGSNCQGNGNLMVVGSLVVTAQSADTTLALDAPSPASVTYGSTGPVTLSATLTSASGGVDGATVAFAVDGSPVATAVTNAAGVATVSGYNPSLLPAGPHTVDASFAGETIAATTYNASTGTTQTLTVTKATPTVTFGAAPTPTFGDGVFTVSATTTNTDSSTLTYSVVTGPCALVSGATFSSTGGGACLVQASGAATANFEGTSATQTVNIAKATATVSVTGFTGTYDGTAHSATGTATGVGGVNLGASLNLGASFTNVPGGTANWTFTGGADYTDQSGSVSITINKAAATIVVTPYSVTYDAAPHTATGTATGVLGETLAGLDLAATTHTNAGSYPNDPWTFTDVTGNYENASGTVNDLISKAAAAIVVTPYAVTYDAAPHTATGSATGVLGETLAGLDLAATTHTNAGIYTNDPWTFTDVTGNYENASGAVNDAIAPKGLNIAAKNRSKILGETVIFSGTEFVATGLVGTDAVTSVTLTSPGAPASATVAGSPYPITPSNAVGTGLGNYTIAYTDGTLTVAFNVCVLYDQTKSHKKGSTIPIKLNLCDVGGNNVSSPGDVVNATMLARVSSGTSPFLAEDSGNANPDNNFRLTGSSYLFNLSTKSADFQEGQWLLAFTVNGVSQPSYGVSFFIK